MTKKRFIKTQSQRHKLISDALWLAAESYLPSGESRVFAVLNVEDAADCILGMLDDLEMLKSLPAD